LRCRNPVAGGTDSRGSFASTHCQQHMSDVCLEKEKDNGERKEKGTSKER
jgi:hypothetical protein